MANISSGRDFWLIRKLIKYKVQTVPKEPCAEELSPLFETVTIMWDEQNDGLIDAMRDPTRLVAVFAAHKTFLRTSTGQLAESSLRWLSWLVSWFGCGQCESVVICSTAKSTQAVLASASTEDSLAPRLKMLLEWRSGATTLWANSSASCQHKSSQPTPSVKESILGCQMKINWDKFKKEMVGGTEILGLF